MDVKGAGGKAAAPPADIRVWVPPPVLAFFASGLDRREGLATQTLWLADFAILATLGVDTARYTNRDYRRTQEIADAAFFLGFDGLIAPSARWSCLNLVLFTDRIPPDRIELIDGEEQPIDWEEWRKRQAQGKERERVAPSQTLPPLVARAISASPAPISALTRVADDA